VSGKAHPLNRIGPNAITRVIEALDALEGKSATASIFDACRLSPYLTEAPSGPVPESEIESLHQSLREALDPGRAETVCWISGQRTADYLLSRRIPLPVQRLLKVLPAPIAGQILAKAILRNSWTFAGSGRVSFSGFSPLVMSIWGNPLCRHTHSATPVCGYYAAVLERLFSALVHDPCHVVETECEAMGHASCRFEISWAGSPAR
jgi:divinyl protochlorophyllide a 8-vinyl-reductase